MIRVFNDIVAELRAQGRKWGVQDHAPEWWLAILVEEVGEAAEALLRGDGAAWRGEMVQVATVAVAIIKKYDEKNPRQRRAGKNK